jgi:hypothetical protein
MRLTKLHDPSKTYLVRVCMTLEDAIWVSRYSVVRNCMECDAPIWYDTAQSMPAPPEGMNVEPEEILLCLTCTALHGSLDKEPMIWLDPENEDS